MPLRRGREVKWRESNGNKYRDTLLAWVPDTNYSFALGDASTSVAAAAARTTVFRSLTLVTVGKRR